MGNNGQLNERQKLFCEKIVVNPNATQAAIGAGYAKRSASSIGHENQQKPKIKRYINQLRQERNLRAQVTADRVLAELAKITFAEKGVKTGYKLKALNILAKHVGLFDKQSREDPEIPSQEELPQTDQETLTEKQSMGMAIFSLLIPQEREAIRQAWRRKIYKNRDFFSCGDGKDDFKDFDLIEFTREQGKIDNLKAALMKGFDRIFDIWQ